ncbi:hypothetical protein P153DRAFT_279226 [Dothidotthia symphoricarpi CBS 119687]|uniref:Pleckstrin homology domain-containing protein n=1 Tax=Dothidotthia symphoricarpi CBS 119687 TaxID=1392245 RepID=A0A6A6ASS7_9PLEO|nr:uncharacterized protein P153DRAFT_279226 [Dothidotthia symphoricarpi CBS 119687]KAF2134626.1 hypothetical protein P153DRAFT_279226 [Dothidotthia symphoricarpi CBS 119687]
MVTDYFSDNEVFITNQPLPSPAGTPYHSMSRRTSRYGTPASELSSSPAPFPSDTQSEFNDAANNENISILDPRRFTPTLHANLVSEILNLRRELDSKHKFIEDLETNLHTVRNENDTLAKQASSSAKETRVAKRQLQHFENETTAALEEIAGDRDKAQESNVDLKQKLEAAQKKLRSQDDDSTMVHDMWAREKEVWAEQKQSLERKVNISEGRLKMLLNEIALQEAAQEEAELEAEGEDARPNSRIGPESDAGSINSSPRRRPSTRVGRHSRNMSSSSYRSIGRNYRMSLISADGQGRGNGISLADELIFDEEEEDLEELELDSDDFPENEMRARRNLETRQSICPDDKAKRILGLSNNSAITGEHGQSNNPEETSQSTVTMTPRGITLIFPPTRPQYIDTGVQPSPPPSPKRIPMVEASSQTTETPVHTKPHDSSSTAAEVEANQSRKRTSMPPVTSGSPLSISLTPCMTSSSVQTVEHPPSPPATPKVIETVPASPVSFEFKAELISTSTQTELLEEPEVTSKRAPPPASVSIPSIAIHAPTSAPSSPKGAPILPPGTKTTSTQTSNDLATPMRSFGMQTEPIRIDNRSIKLPPHLLPSSISSHPGTPEPQGDRQSMSNDTGKDAYFSIPDNVEPIPRRSLARQDLKSRLEQTVEDRDENRYENNNGGRLTQQHQTEILSMPFRTSSLFAGFDGPSSDEEEHADDSDDEFGVPMFATPVFSSRIAKNRRIVNPPTPVPEDTEAEIVSRPSEDSFVAERHVADRNSLERPAKIGKPARTSLSRQPSIRRSAMIQNGTATHMRSRSPSQASIGSVNHAARPPFPVPARSSSRNKPMSKSEGSHSPTPRGNGSQAGRRPYSAKHQRKESLRKVRSAAVVSKPIRVRSTSPALPSTPSIPETDSIPPLPSDAVSTRGYGHRPQPSINTIYTSNGSVASSGTQASVVDAIAAAMIGEFMWKYVRKRKAFGGPDTPLDVSRAAEEASLANNGVRHKRWVWISPYERAILWSSKQPTSGSALMGKSGRKLIIQSVLDVVDNNPAPKNETVFNRSILILTPARALKFTTTTRERHYLWLTALSFLAHSSSPIPDLNSMPPIPPPVEELPQRTQGATLRRSRVQDSVRLAKGRANPISTRYASRNEPMPSLPSLAGYEDAAVSESASPPAIPRGPFHGRKRSSTGPSPLPPPSMPIRSFSHQHVPSVYSNGSSDMYSAMHPPSAPSSLYNPTTGVTSSRTSEASTATRQHFLNNMGTMRMEAFIDNTLGEPTQVGRRRGSSQWSASTRDQHIRSGGIFDDFESHDPFRGF